MGQLRISFGADHSSKKHGCHIPLMPISGDYCYCFAVAFGNDTCLRIVAWGMEGHPVTYSEALHLLLHARLLEVAQACNDLSVELCELGLAEFCDVDGHGATISNCCGCPDLFNS